MQDVLFALQTDLASSIAIRYLRQLEKLGRLNVQAIHVPDMADLGRSPGGGWVQQTWENASSVLAWFLKLWDEIPAEPDILVCHFEASKEKGTFLENDSDLISDIDGRFFKYGKKIASIKTAKGSSNELALLVRDHALLVSPLPESGSHMAQMLAKSPCPILFCPEFTID